MKPALGLAFTLLMVPLGGCVMEGNSEDRCTDWTRPGDEADVHPVHLRLENERPQPVCVRITLAGSAVAKVPLGAADGSERAPVDERTIATSDPRLTVRVDDWNGDGWAADAVDLRGTPYVVATAVEDDLTLATLERPAAR